MEGSGGTLGADWAVCVVVHVGWVGSVAMDEGFTLRSGT